MANVICCADKEDITGASAARQWVASLYFVVMTITTVCLLAKLSSTGHKLVSTPPTKTSGNNHQDACISA